MLRNVDGCSSLAVLAVAVASYVVHNALDLVPDAAVQMLVRACGARRADGFDLRMWLHSLCMGIGAAGASLHETLTADVTEPAASYLCLPPPSTLAWAIPAAEMGYAVHDLRDALRVGNVSFILHGAFVGSFCALLFYLGVAHHITVALTVHISSVFLNLRRVDFGPQRNTAVDVSFAVSFVLLRVLFLPALWVIFLLYARRTEPSTWGACMLGGRVVYLAFAGGAVLHGLNAYWAWLIVVRLRTRWRDDDGLGRSGGAEGHYHRSSTS